MKKTIQIAFAIALLIISVISTVVQSEVFDNIIYSVVVPSFLLSLISFLSEVSQKCGENAEQFRSNYTELGELRESSAKQELEWYEKGNYTEPFREGYIPKDILEEFKLVGDNYKNALVYSKAKDFLGNCKKLFDIANLSAYVLLFLSLILSPYIVKLLSAVNMNCITLWSLTLLYFSVELKSEVCAWCFGFLVKVFKKLTKDELK